MATLPAPGADWDAALDRLDAVGIDTLAVADHFTGGWELEPLIALAVASQRTSRLRLQTNVLCNDYRHPVLLHRMAATLDLLSNGRLELGLGAGWLETDFVAAGIPFDSPGRRIDRLREALLVLKGLFGEGPLSYSGADYSIHELTGVPPSTQRPHPPLFVGGGSRRILTLAGQEADIVGLHVNLRGGRVSSDVVAEMNDDRLAQKLSWVREGAESAGRSLRDLELHMNFRFCCISEDEVKAQRFADEIAERWDVPAETIRRSPSALIGTPEQVVETLLRRRSQFGVSYVHFDPYPLDDESWDLIPRVIADARSQ